MYRLHRILILGAVLALAPVLAGCEDFDLDKLDVFGLNKKKPLPGERHDLFPGGVPGVTQGIPPEYMKSNVEKQQAAEAAAAAEQQKADAQKAAEDQQQKAAEAEAAAKPKPKPKKKVVRKPASQPAQVTVQRERNPQAAQPSGNNQQPQQGTQAAPGQQSDPVWNSAPPPGTFSR
jgi:outer membrane biosynthesis protein TonB